ncbi:hypothetical protein QDY66_11310 [Kingella negevensis]|nr:AEC family transporter [Kingella negevensis]MDK4679311.1 hypothetical protein [Kingella negevensis]MDK4682968.1 hypothetical protein [Kingella negevensis]MDK4691168.1 hypothetical protein [Kingella negevensis]MDK4693684.1 hypothetical protein [Kingella negevensis]MDK4700500.1 hypothetical protein [Kingella negevensis]
MTKIDDQIFKNGLSVFVFGFIAYLLLIALSFVLSPQHKGDKKDTLRMLTIFGSTTFFGLPIINAILPAGTLYANLFNIAYRVFLYSYALIVMSGAKFEKKHLKTIFLNPIVIATFAGFILWMLQPYMPKVEVAVAAKVVKGELVPATTAQVAFYRIDQTLPWVFKGFKYLGDLSSPLAWLAIGMTLASISIKEAVKEKAVWIYAVMKLVVVPPIFLVIMYLFNAMFGGMGFSLNYAAVFAVTIMLATPPATVAVAYAINYDKESVFADDCFSGGGNYRLGVYPIGVECARCVCLIG